MHFDPFLQALPDETSLPSALQALHSTCGQYSGQCTVAPGRGWLNRVALRLAGMPMNPGDIPVQLRVYQDGPRWTWTRDFDGHITRSRLTYDKESDCVREEFGRISIWLKPVHANGRLEIGILRLRFFGIPCPKMLLPRSKTVEWQDEEGRFRFDVSADMPLIGTLIRYHGWLKFDHARTDAG